MNLISQRLSYSGFCFDSVEPATACLPYGPGCIRLPRTTDTPVRTLRVSGRCVALRHTAEPATDAEDCFFDRGKLLEPPAAGRGGWLVKRLGLAAAVERLVRFAEGRPGFRQLPGLRVTVNGTCLGVWRPAAEGPFEVEYPVPPHASRGELRIELALAGAGWGRFVAWLGRQTAGWPLPRDFWLRLQKHRFGYFQHRRLRLQAVALDGEPLCSFDRCAVHVHSGTIRRYCDPGLNLIGLFLSPVGVGESARCAARAARAVHLPAALIPLNLPQPDLDRDREFAAQLREDNPHPINVFHLWPLASTEIDATHGPRFRRGKYNIAYWHWELTEFPDTWTQLHRYYDEIWTSSRFSSEAIGRKVPLPVLTMPHCIEFPVPSGDFRQRFALPEDRYLFLVVFDLGSSMERKNPQAALAAYRGLLRRTSRPAALVMKVRGAEANPRAWAELQAAARDLPGCHLMTAPMSRQALYELEQACDCLVSLHRAEGFGLVVAEAMYMGKPAISTNWSATAEFVTADNGCPVAFQLQALDRNCGVFAQGEQWAEADVEHATHYMHRLVEDPAWGVALGRRAADDIRRQFAPAAIGNLYRRRIASMAHW